MHSFWPINPRMAKCSIQRSIRDQVRPSNRPLTLQRNTNCFLFLDGDIYVCGFAEKETQELPDSGDAVSVDAKSCDRLRDIAVHVASTLKDANVEIKQACYLPQSNDGVPLIGRLHGLNNVYIATVTNSVVDDGRR